jgi:hypothetical protein
MLAHPVSYETSYLIRENASQRWLQDVFEDTANDTADMTDGANGPILRQQLFDHVSVNIGQSIIASLESVG